MYFSVLINEAISGYLLVLQLRAGNRHPGKGGVGYFTLAFLAAETILASGADSLDIVEIAESLGC